MKMRSLRLRTVVQLVSVLALALGAFCVVMALVVRERIRSEADQLVFDKSIIYALTLNSTNPAWSRDDPRNWESHRYTIIAQSFDTNWNVLYRSQKLPSPVVPTERARREIQHAQGWVLEDATAEDGGRYRVATVAARRNVTEKAYAYVQMLTPTREQDEEMARFVFWLAGGSLVVLVSGGLAAFHLAGQWSAPLGVIGQAAEAVDPKDLSRQRMVVPVDVPEVVPLVTAFNSLLDRLEVTHSSQQRFVADASHELKTPLTVLRGEIEVALRRDRTGEEYRRVLESCREEIESLSRLVDGLLVLARCDVRRDGGKPASGDLGRAAREVGERLQMRARERGVEIVMEAAETVEVPLDEHSLVRVVMNLVENAIRYSPPGEQVRLVAADAGGNRSLRVTDRGIGIEAEHHNRIFDRFYRVELGRSREGGGTGLGLAIVKALVESSGGRVSVRSEVGKGSEFEVSWPTPTAVHLK